jgi:hypothetical protein
VPLPRHTLRPTFFYLELVEVLDDFAPLARDIVAITDPKSIVKKHLQVRPGLANLTHSLKVGYRYTGSSHPALFISFSHTDEHDIIADSL